MHSSGLSPLHNPLFSTASVISPFLHRPRLLPSLDLLFSVPPVPFFALQRLFVCPGTLQQSLPLTLRSSPKPDSDPLFLAIPFPLSGCSHLYQCFRLCRSPRSIVLGDVSDTPR